MVVFHFHHTALVIDDIRGFILERMSSLLEVCDAIALLDMLHGFAELVSVSEGLVAPEYTVDGPIAILNGKNPILHKMVSKKEFQSEITAVVPNSTFMTAQSNIQIITGEALRSLKKRAITTQTNECVPFFAFKIGYIFQCALSSSSSHVVRDVEQIPSLQL
jgi:hypothetical protein